MSTDVSRRGNGNTAGAVLLSMIIPGAGSIYARQFTAGFSLMACTAVLLVINFITGWVPFELFVAAWALGIGHAAGAASSNR